jgi:uncharacterized protein (DUF305 family)
MMLIPRLLILAIPLLTGATGASSQQIDTPKPPEGEQATPMLIQTLGNDQNEIQKEIDGLKSHFATLLAEPVGQDVDRSLSQKLMEFQDIQIDMAQLILAYATDPELRRLAAATIEIATTRITAMRDWQVNQKILQQQITSPVKP